MCAAPTRSPGEHWPCGRIFADSRECCFDLGCKFVSRTGPLLIVVVDGLSEFAFGDRKDTDLHRRLIRLRTAAAELALRMPASWASIRSSTSSAHARRCAWASPKLLYNSSMSCALSVGGSFRACFRTLLEVCVIPVIIPSPGRVRPLGSTAGAEAWRGCGRNGVCRHAKGRTPSPSRNAVRSPSKEGRWSEAVVGHAPAE